MTARLSPSIASSFVRSESIEGLPDYNNDSACSHENFMDMVDFLKQLFCLDPKLLFYL